MVLGRALAALPADVPVRRFEAWLKGPVPYGAGVRLRGGPTRDGWTFGVHVDGETRPAPVGRTS